MLPLWDAGPEGLAFAVCLSSIVEESGHLYAHVSKVPQEGTDLHAFVQLLNATAARRGAALALVHRKINVAYDLRRCAHGGGEGWGERERDRQRERERDRQRERETDRERERACVCVCVFV